MIPTDTPSATTDSLPAATRRSNLLTRERSLDWLTGGIVLAVYAVVRLMLLRGPMPYDPGKYFDTAVDFPDVPVDLWTLRIGLVAPVRAAVLLFGPSEAALYAVPIASGLALAAAVYVTMLVLFHDRVLAAAAGLVTVLHTEYMLNSSWIYPDVAAAATLTTGFLCLVLGGIRAPERTNRAATVAVVCAGVLFGWTYLIREFSLILAPAVLAAAVLLRYPVRRIGILAGAALATFGLELLYGFVRYGDPFLHSRMLISRGDKPVPPVMAARVERIQDQLDSLLDTVLVFPRLVLTWRTGWIFLLLVAVFVASLALRRDRRLWVLAVWCFSFWAIMAVLGLGSLSSGRWIVNVTNVRYWYPIFPPLVMGAFGGLALLVRRFLPGFRGAWPIQVSAGVLAVLVVVPGLVEYGNCVARDAWRHDPAERWHELRSWFARPDADRYRVVLTDRFSQRLVPAFTSTTFGERLWHGEVGIFPRRRVTPTEDLGPSLLLVHKDRFVQWVPRPGIKLKQLRNGWSPLFLSDDGRMILLARRPAAASEAVEGQPWWSLASDRAPPADPGECGRPPY